MTRAADAPVEEAVGVDATGSDRARRDALRSLVEAGRYREAVARWDSAHHEEDLAWVNERMVAALRAGDLALAGEYAHVHADLSWASRWYPADPSGHGVDIPAEPPIAWLTTPKLRHDAGQFRYLHERGLLPAELVPLIDDYLAHADELDAAGAPGRKLTDAERERFGHAYNRIVHVRETPRVERALSSSWSGAAVEDEYFGHPPGVVVVDDFLTPDALESLLAFCLESTVWSSAYHPYGRLGAQFQNGFNCPLLIQVAEELRDALPRLVRDRYPLRHMWGYKSGPTLPADAVTHADFAAVNVNFWVTPDDANLDPGGGGMVIFGVEAPLDWDFHMYNSRLEEAIVPYLQRQQPGVVEVPYRQNRAVIFNSDLFHGTSELRFREGYEHRRINVTMLYGDREDDLEHRGALRPELANQAAVSQPWRSAAFTSVRRRR